MHSASQYVWASVSIVTFRISICKNKCIKQKMTLSFYPMLCHVSCLTIQNVWIFILEMHIIYSKVCAWTSPVREHL